MQDSKKTEPKCQAEEKKGSQKKKTKQKEEKVWHCHKCEHFACSMQEWSIPHQDAGGSHKLTLQEIEEETYKL